MKTSKIAMAIGGLAIEIRSTKSLHFLTSKRFLPFQADIVHPEITWEFQIVNPGPVDQGKSAPATGCSRLLSSRSPQLNACLQQARKNPEWSAIEMNAGAVTILDFKKNRANIFFNREFVNELGVHGIGPAMLAPFLPNFEACLLHASAIVRHGRTAIFLAADEGGKTTAARLSPDGTILGDDQVLVQRGLDGFQVSGTPWGLHMDGKLRAPLAGLFLLEKARRFSLVPLRARELLPHLWQEAKALLAILPKPLKIKAFDILSELATAVPAARMSFPKHFIDWEAIDKIMAG